MLHSCARAVFVGAFLLLAAGAPAQNLFVSCAGNGNIVEINPQGGQSVFATGLNTPNGLAFDSAGDLFVANEGSGTIDEFINNGGVLSSTPVLYASGLDDPFDLAFGPGGLLFASEYGNGDIAEISSSGTVSTYATGLAGPEGLAFGTGLVLYVANHNGGSITSISAGGTKTTVVSDLGSPSGLIVSGLEILESSQIGNDIDEIVSKTAETYVSGLDDPNGIALDGADKLFEADTGSGDINEFTKTLGPTGGITETNFGSGLDEPVGLAFQPVPEPSALGLLAVGATAFLGWRRKVNGGIK